VRELGKLLTKTGIKRKYIFLLILRAPFDALRTWMLANLLKSVFLCIEEGVLSHLVTVCLFYGICCFMLFAYNGTIWSIYASFAVKTEAKLLYLMTEKILNMPLVRIRKDTKGEWLTRLNSDIQTAINVMNAPGNMVHLTVALLNTVLSSFLLLFESGLLFWVTWLCILPHLFINYQLVIKSVPAYKKEAQQAMAENTAALEPLITEAETILIYEAEELVLRQYEKASRKLLRANLAMHLRQALSSSIFQLFGQGGYFLLLLIGYGLIYNEIMTLSDLLYCFQVRGAAFSGMFMFMNCRNIVKSNMVCVKRVNDTLA